MIDDAVLLSCKLPGSSVGCTPKDSANKTNTYMVGGSSNAHPIPSLREKALYVRIRIVVADLHRSVHTDTLSEPPALDLGGSSNHRVRVFPDGPRILRLLEVRK